MARFITGQEITEVVGAVEETFIKQREILGEAGGTGRMGDVSVDDAVLFLARTEGGAVASFEATRLATGDKNANRIEIHGEHGALKFNFERMNELEWYDQTLPAGLQGWSTINVTRGDDGHPYAGNWWPAAHILGYEHGFVNQVADMMRVLGGQEPEVPLCDFADALQTQKVLEAAIVSARERRPVMIDEFD